MFKILIAVDGSESSKRAVEFLVKSMTLYKEPPEIHLVTVVLPLVLPSAKKYVSQEIINDYYAEEAENALTMPKQILNSAKIKYVEHKETGQIAETIIKRVKEIQCDLIYMGTRGMGSVANIVMGSVASKVLHLTSIPVVLVK